MMLSFLQARLIDNDSYSSRLTYIISLRYVYFAMLIENSVRFAFILPVFFSIMLFISPQPDFPVRRAAILTRTTTCEIKRDRGRQTWRVTYGVKCGDKNEKLRCQVIYFYAAADIFTLTCP